MDQTKIEQRVISLLENSPIEREGEEQPLRKALFHMMMAVGIMDTMTNEQKKLVIKEKKHFDYFFSTKFNIKNRQRKEKKKGFPHTPYKDKAEKEREIEGGSSGEDVSDFGADDLAMRKKAFWNELLKRERIYGREMLQDFFDYWGEESRTKGIMLYEKKTHWNLDSRLHKWSRNSQTLANAEAADRMNRRLKRQKEGNEESGSKERRSKELAAQREEANARLEAQIEQSKAGAVTMEEYIRKNPNSTLAKKFGGSFVVSRDATKIPADGKKILSDENNFSPDGT